MSHLIDLNADLGEGYGAWHCTDDMALLDLVSSASIACGFHAGDPAIMRAVVGAARDRGVTIGAHPGYPDRRGFGRVPLALSADTIRADCVYQVGALAATARSAGTSVRYVKPHGALYHRLAVDADAAEAVAGGLAACDPSLAVLTMPGGALAAAAEQCGLRVVREAFLDRGYRADGTLIPRGEPGALLADPDVIAARAVHLVRDGALSAIDGTPILLGAESLCVHGDGPGAVDALRAVRRAFAAANIAVRSPLASS